MENETTEHPCDVVQRVSPGPAQPGLAPGVNTAPSAPKNKIKNREENLWEISTPRRQEKTPTTSS